MILTTEPDVTERYSVKIQMKQAKINSYLRLSVYSLISSKKYKRQKYNKKINNYISTRK